MQRFWTRSASYLSRLHCSPLRDIVLPGRSKGSRRAGGGGTGNNGFRGSVYLTTAAASAAYSSPAMARGERLSIAPRICILGGGFGGLYTAVRLENLLWLQGSKPQVTLIDQSARFVFKPLLYELLNGGASAEEVAPFFTKLLAPYSTNFIQGSVQAVEEEEEGKSVTALSSGGRVVLSSGVAVEYDWLVLALGADSVFFGIEGVKEHCVPFCTYSDAMKVESQLEALEVRTGTAEVLVVGTGYAGIELATTVAERLGSKGQVRMVTAGKQILEGCPPGQQEAARKMLQEQSVPVITEALVTRVGLTEDQPASTSQPSRKTVTLKTPKTDSQVLQADLVLWTAGSSPVSKEGVSDKTPKLPFPATDKGAVRTDPMLRVKDHPRVFALGDVSGSELPGPPEAGNSLPATAQVAFQQADYVAWNLWASINRRPLLPFKYQHLGDMMSLGRASGAVTLPIPLAPPLQQALNNSLAGSLLKLAGVQVGTNAGQAVTVEGYLASALRRAAYLYRQPTAEHRLSVGASWLQQAASDGASLAQRVLSGQSSTSRRSRSS
ncbi:hypothetical protein CVIRNUC_000660 [Coccomyxa viridis]|uniref:FAD/NAD(P)-binding domain-containing protein n=1 Tax=Coccomyxa viridis TaxID=1274662 RepID=A0AAV1HVE9_9CHLO|nr:hypothetical protein CVIRNUC_000660 [Coccomyxa viridis]